MKMAEAIPKAEEMAKEEVKHKKLKTDVCSDAVDSTTEQLFSTFEGFTVDRILNNSLERKYVTVVGNLKDKEGLALVMLEKQSFNIDKLSEIFSQETKLTPAAQKPECVLPELAGKVHHMTATISPTLNEAKVMIVYPALEKHIIKYEKQTFSVVNETPELYEKVTKKFLETSAFNKEWIYNILEHKKEKDRIVFEDSDPEVGFILLPDLKWTGKQMDDMYLQAIVKRRDLTSIRDLRGSHLPLLRNIYQKGTQAILDKYGVGQKKLRIYLHYHPSFYHLHVHFTSINFEAPGTRIGKAHLLADVINKLEMSPEFYQQAVLTLTVKDNHPLRLMYAEQGCFTD